MGHAGRADSRLSRRLAGGYSCDERLMLAGRVDGVSADDEVAAATLRAIRQFANERPTVYLPTHDPESAARLVSGRRSAGGP